MFQHLRASLGLLILFALLTGVAYPLAITGAAQVLFPHQAQGSLVEQNGQIIGSELIGQNFYKDSYFHSRPSAAGSGYDAGNSSGSNISQSSKDFTKTVTARVAELRKSGDPRLIPVDLVTASASGLDPDISVAAAQYQVLRVSEARGLSAVQLEKLVADNTTQQTFGLLGEDRVNVLALNRALDALPAVAVKP